MTDPSSSPSANTRRLWAFLIITGIVVVLVLIGFRLLQNDAVGTALGEKPADFVLESYSGESISTADLRGRVVLVNFWASWCVTCPEDVRMLEAAWQDIQRDQGEDILFLGVAYMDTRQASLDFLAEHGMTYPSGPDLRGEISRTYRVSSVPETFILDRDGVLRYIRIGPFSGMSEIYSALEMAANPPVQ